MTETIPDRMRAVADAAEHMLDDPNGNREVMLAFCSATLRTAALAWPAHGPAGAPPGAPERIHEAGRQLGFEQGMAKYQEYTAAAEQDEREAAERRGGPVPGTHETARVARVAGVVVGHWRERRKGPQVDHELIGGSLASLLDALLIEVDHALAAARPRD